jgi:RNA polymerase sigma-70 factor, ECF subfamily
MYSVGLAHCEATAALSDLGLMERVLKGDEAALAAIYDRYSRLIFTIAQRIVGDRSVAEEVVQDVIHAVWRTAGSFQPGGNPVAWLIGITRHRAIDATRLRSFRTREREHSIEGVDLLAADTPAEEAVERRLLGEQVRAALAALPAAQRESIELAYYGGLSQSEIAERLAVPLGTVKTRMRLGMLRLRFELAPALGANSH